MTLEDQLNLLEDKIRRLKIEFDIFFSGASKKAPYELRGQIELTLKKLMDEKKMSQAQRFRYNSLTTRYYSYRDLWRRIMQAKEECVDLGFKSKTEGWTYKTEQPEDQSLTSTPARISESQPHSTQPANQLKIQITDPQKQEDKVKELYDFLVAANKKIQGEGIVSYHSFKQLVENKTTELKKDRGCDNVTFTIQIEKGKIQFKAKAGEDQK